LPHPPGERRTHQRPEPKVPAISTAIEEVNKVVEELKRALDEMEEVLELLELAERQKIDDEREIEELKRALRRLHRPRESERH
jgi:methyl-accepting chemotaxis protein